MKTLNTIRREALLAINKEKPNAKARVEVYNRRIEEINKKPMYPREVTYYVID